ncbi:MAG: DUF5683 domain-containing protein [Candidatus Neomarinimicrobiota bacterium]
MKYFKDIWSSVFWRGPLGPATSILPVLTLIFSAVCAQDTRPTVAVVDFEGRGISQLEAQTLTDRFRSSIANTGGVRLVERRMMEEVLQEQGFQQTGCTSDECAVEVGQLLGVQQMFGGAIGKVGETFTIDARMISVETGESIRTRNVSYVGQVDGLIIEIEFLAYQMVDMEPPEELIERRKLGAKSFAGAQPVPVVKTRMGAMMRSLVFPGLGQFYAEKTMWAFGWILSELAVGGLTYVSYTAYQSANDDYDVFQTEYNNATDPQLVADYKAKAKDSLNEMTTANDQITMLAYAAAGLWLGNVIHAYLVGPRLTDQANSSTSLQFAFDPKHQQAQLRLSIALD